MNRAKRIRGRSVVLAVSGSLLCLAVLAILLDPIPFLSDIISVARIRWELPRAVERWQTQGIARYKVNVKGAVPMACILDGELTVQDGQLVGVRMRENALVPETPLRDIDPDEWDLLGCTFQDLTVEAMFARVHDNLDKLGLFGAPLTIRFDEASGYITEYRFGRSSRGGIFGFQLSECCTSFEFSDLTIYPRE